MRNRSYGRRFAGFGIAAATLAAAVTCALAPASALAADIPATAAHAAPGATYNDWGYVTTAAAGKTDVDAWLWSEAGWQAKTIPSGSSVWIAPWGSGWSWAYWKSAWYAVTTDRLATWKCTAPAAADQTVFSAAAGGSVAIKKYNATSAVNAGTAKRYDTITVLCKNGFADADFGKTTVYALVRVKTYLFCTGVWNMDCVMNPTASTTYTGYVDVTKIKDMMTRPPIGVFGNVPTDAPDPPAVAPANVGAGEGAAAVA